MEKMRMESVDVISRNLALLRKLFPNCVTERIDKDGNKKLAVNMKMFCQMFSEEVLAGEEAYELT